MLYTQTLHGHRGYYITIHKTITDITITINILLFQDITKIPIQISQYFYHVYPFYVPLPTFTQQLQWKYTSFLTQIYLTFLKLHQMVIKISPNSTFTRSPYLPDITQLSYITTYADITYLCRYHIQSAMQ